MSPSKVRMAWSSGESIRFLDTRIRLLSASTSTWDELTLRLLPSKPRCSLMKTVFLARSVPGSWIFTIGDAVAISTLLLSKPTWLLNDRRGAVCPRLRNRISGQHDAQRWKAGHKLENL